MTELSFNEQSHQVSNSTQTGSADGINCDENAVEFESQLDEKHVTIDEELPVIYKPKSFSVPDLLDDEAYVNSKHQHPALKFSTSNVGGDTKLFKKWFPKEKPTCYSPFSIRKNKSKETNNKLGNTESTRQRGKTFPEYSNDEVNDIMCRDRLSETKNRSQSTNSYDTKWLNFWKKINLFPKLNRMKPRRRSKNRPGSFHDLPPIRCSASMADITDMEANNNALVTKKQDNEDHYFHVTKSYKPALQSLKPEPYTCETVKLKRIKSLPIL